MGKSTGIVRASGPGAAGAGRVGWGGGVQRKHLTFCVSVPADLWTQGAASGTP